LLRIKYKVVYSLIPLQKSMYIFPKNLHSYFFLAVFENLNEVIK